MEYAETSLEHVRGAEHFTVFAGEQWSCNRIRKLHEQYPEEVEIIAENEDGSLIAHIPLKWVRISPPRQMTLTEERRKELSEQGKRLAEHKRASALQAKSV